MAKIKKADKAKKEETKKAEKPAAKKETGGPLGKELTVKCGTVEYKGKCVSERKINGGAQVFLQLNGAVSRWFDVKDIVK